MRVFSKCFLLRSVCYCLTRNRWSELSAGDVLYAGNPKDELLPQDVPVIELPSSARYWKTYTHNAELSNIVQQRFREGPNVVQCSILTTINSGDHDNGDSSVLLEGAIGKSFHVRQFGQ